MKRSRSIPYSGDTRYVCQQAMKKHGEYSTYVLLMVYFNNIF